LNVFNEEVIIRNSRYNWHQEAKNSMPKTSIDEDHQYDDEYFDVYEKIWTKQAASQVDKW